ncbi:hypothetical protein [Nostoc sp. KVJ3]|uniref:hypothetical protein n=1 Tax=Nostoc sp. KVJ3 TaxID=457945 RepID=UPI002238FA0E|nr:hypothetical protein [Nostoc sp. KVJ3]
MVWSLPMDKKAVAIGLSLTVGISSAAMAWQGTSSDRIYFCIKTPSKTLVCRDKDNRPFRMTPSTGKNGNCLECPSSSA